MNSIRWHTQFYKIFCFNSKMPIEFEYLITLSLSRLLCPFTYTEANRREAILEAQKLRSEGTAVALRREKEDC